VKWREENQIDNILVDILATKFATNEDVAELDYIKNDNYVKALEFMEDGYMINLTYTASPFFNPAQIEMRDKMITCFNQTYRPDQTPSSKLYDGDHGDSNLVEKVVEENIYGIELADCLVYPKDTTDLGTLFEVGRAFANDKFVIQFDGESYNIITENIFEKLEINKDQVYSFDCNKKIQAVLLGYVSEFVDKEHILYELKGARDNIMLSVNYTHIEFDKDQNKYVVIERNKDERDK
jgi:nucleoside 2-deoxyribosyltransferase